MKNMSKDVKTVKCVEKMPDGEKCGQTMLVRHVDTDRMGNPQQWYKCKFGHWRAIPIKKE